MLGRSARENVSLPHLRRLSRGGMVARVRSAAGSTR